MSVFLALEEAAAHDPGIGPYIVGAIAASVFILSGIVTHSFRDVAHRHSHKFGQHQNTSGHH